jgi:hypothetical protein
LHKLEKEREEISGDIFQELQKVDLKSKKWKRERPNPLKSEKSHDFEKIDSTVSNLAKVEKKLEQITKLAEKGISDQFDKAKEQFTSRPTVKIKESLLKKFIAHIEEYQIDRGEECGGLFFYKREKEGILVNKFEPVLSIAKDEYKENNYLIRKEKDILKLIRDTEEKVITCHSHPAHAKKHHSDQDRESTNRIVDKFDFDFDAISTFHRSDQKEEIEREDYEKYKGEKDLIRRIRGASIDILGSKDTDKEWIWIIPQVITKDDGDSKGRWRNLPLKVINKSREWPQVEAYNKATVEAIVRLKEGERDRRREAKNPENNWYRIYREMIA